MMSAIPISMPVSIGMPTNLNPVFRPIQNIGKCSATPTATIVEPHQKAAILYQLANRDIFGFISVLIFKLVFRCGTMGSYARLCRNPAAVSS